MARYLVTDGCNVLVEPLSDGLTGVEANADGRFLALPASTCTRLRADSLEALGQPPRTLGKVQGESEKHLLPAARLHDGEVANTFTRIEPLDNSIVLFPSRSVHEVTLVECDPTDFGAGRFSVNSYVWTRPVDGC